jgi:hypothetical protein
MADQSPFERLRDLPTIGEIAFGRFGELNFPRRTGVTHEEFGQRTWKKYDERFADRADWKLFRMLVWSESSPAWLPALADLPQVVRAGLASPSLVEQWGILAVLAHVADGCTPNELQKRQVLKLGASDLRALILDFPPLPNSSLACEVVRQLCLRLIFKATEKWPQVEVAMLETALNWCVAWLRQFDPHWSLGRRIHCSFDDADVLAIGNKVVLEGLVITVLTSRLRQVANGLEAASHLEKSERVIDLTRKAYTLANSVWDVARHRLRGTLSFHEDRTRRPGSVRIGNVSDRHGVALRVLVRLASYCEEHLRCAALAHLYLKTVRDPSVASDFAKEYAWRIRQAGLQIDERRRDEGEKNLVRPARRPRMFDPFWRRIRDAQVNDTRWKALSDSFPVWSSIVAKGGNPEATALAYDGVDTLKYLAHAANKGELTNQAVIRAAYQLALDYGFMKWAGKLLGSLQATRQDLLDFAHHLKRFQQLMPFGMDRMTQELWQRQLKECWRSLPGAELPAGDEPLVLHEVLLGRSLQMLRDADGEAARLIALAHYDLVGESESRFAAIREPSLAAHGPATVMPIKVANLLKDLSRSEIGAPVCISIVRLESDRLHLLACGRNREGEVRWVSDTVNGEGETSVRGLSERLGRLQRACREWLEPDENGLDELHIDWGTPFENLCLRISAIAKSLSTDCRWLMLAVDAELAALPWQDLFRRFWNDDAPVLVSLVPSFGWAALSHERKCAYPDDYRRELSTATDLARLQARLPDLTTLRFRIRDAFQAAPWLFNETAIIAGHGKTSVSGFPLIEVADGILTEEDWIELSDYRIVVLHSCFGGHVTPSYLGDLGGLVGLTLGGQTKLLCAPVAEVPVEAAIKLHEHHGKEDGPREFGLRYMEALKENPAVGLYNLYGLPTEYLGKSRRE